jgi:hypothetical protein
VLQSVENDMVNHEGKANRRFQCRVQVRIGASDHDDLRISIRYDCCKRE